MGVIVLRTDEKKRMAKKIVNKLKPKKGIDAKKYCGKIKLPMDPLNYQNKLRNEWQ